MRCLWHGNIDQTRRIACEVSTSDRGQTVENQLRRYRRPLDGWVEHRGRVFRDEEISGATHRAKQPGLDALLKGVARRDFDVVAAFSMRRLGRSLSDLIGLLGELRSAT